MVRLRKWKFNEQLLQETICIGKYYLEHNDLTSQEKAEIKSDISRFKRFINGDFETTSTYRHLSLPMIKKSVLASMKKYRRLFNREFREWLINLQQANIFRYGQYIPRFKLSIDTMADETLTLYGNQAPHFFLQAEALLSEKISLIHYTKTDSSSFCFYSNLLDLPMIIINSKDDASVLTHEIQHGIEYLKDIPTHIFYHELGPIYFELIFSDQTFKSYGKKASFLKCPNRWGGSGDTLFWFVNSYSMVLNGRWNTIIGPGESEKGMKNSTLRRPGDTDFILDTACYNNSSAYIPGIGNSGYQHSKVTTQSLLNPDDPDYQRDFFKGRHAGLLCLSFYDGHSEAMSPFLVGTHYYGMGFNDKNNMFNVSR